MSVTTLHISEGLEGDAYDLHTLLTRLDALVGHGDYEGKIETPVLADGEAKKKIVQAAFALINSFWLTERAHLREHGLVGLSIEGRLRKEEEQVSCCPQLHAFAH
jgi:hypothetical protein